MEIYIGKRQNWVRKVIVQRNGYGPAVDVFYIRMGDVVL